MASRTKRREARKKRQQHAQSIAPALDVHGEVLLNSLEAVDLLARQFAGREHPLADIDAEFQRAVEEFVSAIDSFDPVRLIEIARTSYLPLAPHGTIGVFPAASAPIWNFWR